MSNSTHRGRCGKQMNTNNLLAEANQPIIVRWARTNPLEFNGRTHWKLSVRQSQWGQMQHWAVFVNLNARPNKHNGGPLRSQPSLQVSAKWSTRSSKDIGGPLSSLPSYIDTHYAYSTSSNGQYWAASVNLNTSQVKTVEDRYVPSRAWVRLQSGVPIRQRNWRPVKFPTESGSICNVEHPLK